MNPIYKENIRQAVKENGPDAVVQEVIEAAVALTLLDPAGIMQYHLNRAKLATRTAIRVAIGEKLYKEELYDEPTERTPHRENHRRSRRDGFAAVELECGEAIAAEGAGSLEGLS